MGLGVKSSFHVRKATEADLPQIVQVHLLAFPGFFLSLMGARFLQLLYRGFLTRPGGQVWVAVPVDQPSRVCGVVAGVWQPAGFFRQLLRQQWLAFALASLGPLLRRPWLVGVKLWSALVYRGESLPDFPDAALLSSLGVHPDCHRQGLGRQLVQHFLDQARQAGLPGVYLTTDKKDNEGANHFYITCGFQSAGVCKRPHGRILNRYLIQFE